MKRLVIALVAAGSAACFDKPAAAPIGETSVLVAPGQSPPPTTTDAAMPASLPPPPAAATLVKHNTLYSTGSTFIGVGVGAIVGGLTFAILGAVLPCKLGDPDCPTQSDVQQQKSLGDNFLITGVAAMILGGVCLAVGIPLATVGANQVKREMGYALLVSPRGVGLQF